MKRYIYPILILFVALFVACSQGGRKYKVGVSQCSEDIWREKQNAELRMGKTLLGVFGEAHPLLLKELGVKNAVFCELDLAALLDLKTSPIKASIPARFPRVERDLAFTIDEVPRHPHDPPLRRPHP